MKNKKWVASHADWISAVTSALALAISAFLLGDHFGLW